MRVTPRSRRICAPVPNVRSTATRSRRRDFRPGRAGRASARRPPAVAATRRNAAERRRPCPSSAMRRMAARSGQPRRGLVHADHVAERVLHVDAHQRRLAALEVAVDQRQVHVAIDVVFVAEQAEVAELGVDLLLGNALDRDFLVLQAEADQVGDAADLQAVLLGERLELRAGAPSCRPRSGSRRSPPPARAPRGARDRSPPRCARRGSARRPAGP